MIGLITPQKRLLLNQDFILFIYFLFIFPVLSLGGGSFE